MPRDSIVFGADGTPFLWVKYYICAQPTLVGSEVVLIALQLEVTLGTS